MAFYLTDSTSKAVYPNWNTSGISKMFYWIYAKRNIIELNTMIRITKIHKTTSYNGGARMSAARFHSENKKNWNEFL